MEWATVILKSTGDAQFGKFMEVEIIMVMWAQEWCSQVETGEFFCQMRCENGYRWCTGYWEGSVFQVQARQG